MGNHTIKRVYLAAPWANRSDAALAKSKFEGAGFEVTSRWIDGHTEAKISDPACFEILQQQALDDLSDILRSDVFVILNLQKSEGKATEMGFAYAIGKPIILVGKRTINVFYFLPFVTVVKTVEDAIELLGSI